MTDRTIRALVLLSALGVFLGGLVIGYVLGSRGAPPAAPRPPGPPPPPGVEPLLHEFAARLDLTPAQRDQIGDILRDGDHALREVMARVRPELEERRAAIEARILEVLTEPQRARYREMLPDGLPRPPRPGGPPGPHPPPGGPPPGGPPPHR